MSKALIAALRRELAARANPEKAGPMQAYMKSAMPYYGVPTPILRAACREVFAAHPLGSFEEWQSAALTLWRTARHREERYAAIELTGYKLYRAHQTLETVTMYEEMIVSGAWWDYVDALAVHRIGPLVAAHPKPMKPLMKSWSRSPDMWKRRSAILCQISFKDKTDLGLLYACIEPNLADKEFFIRKAIGWALRQYAWTDPDEVERYVAAREDALSALSKREARKNIGKMNIKA